MDVSTIHKLILSNIEVLSGIKLQGEMYLNTPNPMGKAIKSIKKSQSRSPSPVHSQEKYRSSYNFGSRSSQSSSRSPRSPARSPKRSQSPGYSSQRNSGRLRYKEERRSRSRSRSPYGWRYNWLFFIIRTITSPKPIYDFQLFFKWLLKRKMNYTQFQNKGWN